LSIVSDSGTSRPVPEPDRVVAVRRASLERAGYTPEQALDLACRLEIDLQTALAPRRQGLPPLRLHQIAGRLPEPGELTALLQTTG
jgi:hypothetical protein